MSDSLWPMDYSPPGSSVQGVLQARILECGLPFPILSSWPRDQTHISCISCIGRQILYHCSAWELVLLCAADLICLVTWCHWAPIAPSSCFLGKVKGFLQDGSHLVLLCEEKNLWPVKMRRTSQAGNLRPDHSSGEWRALPWWSPGCGRMYLAKATRGS